MAASAILHLFCCSARVAGAQASRGMHLFENSVQVSLVEAVAVPYQIHRGSRAEGVLLHARPARVEMGAENYNFVMIRLAFNAWKSEAYHQAFSHE